MDVNVSSRKMGEPEVISAARDSECRGNACVQHQHRDTPSIRRVRWAREAGGPGRSWHISECAVSGEVSAAHDSECRGDACVCYDTRSRPVSVEKIEPVASR